MIRMKLAILARSDGGYWGWKTWVGLALALVTISLALDQAVALRVSAGLVAVAILAWTLGWIVAPIQTGGASSDALRPSQFALLPIPPRDLVTGLLAAAFIGKLPAVTAIAFLVHPVLGAREGVWPTVVGALAVVPMVAIVVLLSKVAIGATGRALRSRLGLELAAIQYALLISLSSVGWMTVPLIFQRGPFGDTSNLTSEGLPDGLFRTLLWLPSGWGVAAVHAATDARWGVVALAFALMAGGIAGLGWLWNRQLQAAMVDRGEGNATRAAFAARRNGRSRLPRTPLGAAMGRELRLWFREPRVALEFRTAILSGLFMVGLPLLAGEPMLLPWTGVITAVLAAVCAANMYGLEGTALWLALSVPNGPRHDVWAKVLVYLILFAPTTLFLTMAGAALAGIGWAWPWVIALTVTLVAAGAGIAIATSYYGMVPVPEAARRSGDLMAAADNTGPAFVAMLAILLAASPAAALLGVGFAQDNLFLQWLALPVGVAIGAAVTWWCAVTTIRNLERHGPEMLDYLRHGVKPVVKRTAPDAKLSHWDALTGWRKWVALGSQWVWWIPLAQGIAPIALKIFDVDVTAWFVAPRLPDAWQWPFIVTMLLLAVVLMLLPMVLARQVTASSATREARS